MSTAIRRCDGAHNTMDDDRQAPKPAFQAPPLREEAARGLDLLRSLGAMDAGSKQELDAITRLASAVCQTPIALIALIDSSGLWFVSRVGVAGMQALREESFSDRAILGSDVLVIPDALADPRFGSHPAVMGEPGIRFYARAPLVTPEGLPLGALCVIDHRPRQPTAVQIDALRTLSHAVLTILAKRDLERRLAEVEATTPLGSVPHELNNALAPILSVLEFLRRRLPDPRSQELIGMALASAERIAKMVRRMRGFAREVEGRFPPD